jgi:tetratricopeptide (TPR) repeat protein
VAAAVAASGIAVGVAWTGRGEKPTSSPTVDGPREGAPPLVLDFLVDDRSVATALQSAVSLYRDGRRKAALDGFEQVLGQDPESLYAAVGAALARWPDGTLETLRELAQEHPDSALVPLHEGLALYWRGKGAEAEAAWKRAEAVEPDSPAAIRAESLLHPEMPAGRPFFVPGAQLPKDVEALPPLQQLNELERRAEESGTAEAWIRYGAVLQRAGRPVSARTAYDRAVAIDPQSAEAHTAAAVARFSKDDPSQAFSRLGPLSQRFPDAPVVRFHLGLMLIWLRQVDQAREELEAATADGAGTVWGQEATLLIERLDAVQGQTSP